MKKQALMVLTTLSLFVTLAALSVYAQSDMRLEVNIPFEFSITNHVLPAGEYTVSRLAQNGQNVLVIRSVGCSVHEVFLTLPTRARTIPNQSALVFHQYGDQYFLSKIWTSGNDTGRELGESRAELELIRATSALAKGTSQGQIVSITAHQ
jgi:hypothetical protein